MTFPTLDDIKEANPHLLSESVNNFFKTTDVTITGYVVSIRNQPTLSNGKVFDYYSYYYCDPTNGFKATHIHEKDGRYFIYGKNCENLYINMDEGVLE